MKKIIFFLLIVLGVCLSAHSVQNAVSIELAHWIMSSIQNTSDGTVVYCSESQKEQFPKANVKNITCTVHDASITIQDHETGKEWTGAYKKSVETTSGSVYEVVFEGKTGLMVNSLTEYTDKTDARHTLILRCNTFTLNFFAK